MIHLNKLCIYELYMGHKFLRYVSDMRFQLCKRYDGRVCIRFVIECNNDNKREQENAETNYKGP